MARDIDIGMPTSTIITYPMVETFADLPSAIANISKIHVVVKATGIFGVNRKRSGMYLSDGITWGKISKVDVAGTLNPPSGLLPSNPPSGDFIITNIYRNSNGNLEYEYETVPKS